LDQAPGLDFPGEAGGLVPDLEDWSGTTLPTLTIGYGLAVSPLSMLAAYNAIANDGVYVTPTLVRSEIDADGRERPRSAPEHHRVVSEETARAVTGVLAEVVRNGTGAPAAVEGYTVAGKTGTARKATEGALGYQEGAYVASFAGFLPAESPRLSAIVVLDEPTPYTGAKASAPVFAALARYAVRHFQVPPRPAPDEPGAQTATLLASSATRP
jgi:cell division protein FtsI (penicillin-binding protein 3)